ncbi:MAG: radical SAM protein [Planctomycetota bacterium]|nr:radical SAM protein [Planctomycetota bacterium]
MLNLTTLYCGVGQPADGLRYGRGEGAPRAAAERKPVVVWNITRRCNLQCVHCYSDSEAKEYPGELTFDECRAVVDDLARYGVPAVLLSGGEPLVHPRFFDLASYAVEKGLRLTLSTNGMCIDRATAERLKALHCAYVGISLDGIGETHDRFRGRVGAFERTVAAFRNCKAVGQKVGLRLTLSRHNVADLERVFEFIETENIERVCFYHLVSSGRGGSMQILPPEKTREVLDRIMDRALLWAKAGLSREVLTVGQPADGVYMHLRLQREKSPHAAQTLKFLEWNGGGLYGTGIGIGNIDAQGNVHPDQFWQTYTVGNVRQRPFSEIWRDSSDPILKGLRERAARITGRCAACRYFNLCGGGFRVRAAQTGDPWASDPACYLTDAEIARP